MSISSKKIIEHQKKFGQQIKRLRLEKGYSQLDLAGICDLEKTAISRIENGRTNITLKTAIILSDALQVHVNELFMFEL